MGCAARAVPARRTVNRAANPIEPIAFIEQAASANETAGAELAAESPNHSVNSNSRIVQPMSATKSRRCVEDSATRGQGVGVQEPLEWGDEDLADVQDR